MSEVSELLDEFDDVSDLFDEVDQTKPIRGGWTAKRVASQNLRSRLRAALMEKDGIFRRTSYTTRSKLE